MKFHHVGIACKDIKAAEKHIHSVHTIKSASRAIFDPRQNATVQLFELEEGGAIELVSGSIVDDLLKNGATPYHLCYEVTDLHQHIFSLINTNATLVSPPQEAILFDNRKVAFLQTPQGLIELLEEQPSQPDYHFEINIAGSFTLDPLLPAGKTLENLYNIQVKFQIASYQQVIQSLLDKHSLFHQHTARANVLLLRTIDFFHEREDVTSQEFNQVHSLLTDAIREYLNTSKCPLIALICPSNNKAHNDADNDLYTQLKSISGLQATTLSLIHLEYAPDQNRMAHIPYSNNTFMDIGMEVLHHTYLGTRSPFKVIVTDCDFTLWAGACGDIPSEELVIDQSHLALQDFLVSLANKGFLLCLCSKNNEEDVTNVLRDRDDMPLTMEHITITQINWNNKAENILNISKLLALDLESFIYIDDNPTECENMRDRLPEVFTLHLTDQLRCSKAYQKIWAFEQSSITKADQERTQYYQTNVKRHHIRKNTSSFHDFIKKLDLHVDLHKATNSELERVQQLSRRTHQFRANRAYRPSGSIHCLTVTARDNFGDYGLIGAMYYSQNDSHITLHDFIMSCRVMGRTIEHQMLCYLAALPSIQIIHLKFSSDHKNLPAKQFFEKFKHVPTDEGYEFTSKDILNKKEEESKPNNTKRGLIKNQELTGEHLFLRRIADSYTTPAPQNQPEKTPVSIDKLFYQYAGTSTDQDNDNFFAMGGSSLQAVSMIAEINNEYRVQLSLGDFYQTPTLSHLKCLIKQKSTSVSISTSDTKLSDTQKGMWFFQHSLPMSYTYNMPMTYQLVGKLDRNKLEDAVNIIIRESDTLRTSFTSNEGEPSFSIRSNINLRIAYHDSLSLQEVESEIGRLTQEPFNLAKPPLLRIHLFKVTDDTHVLFMLTHHIIWDGACYRIFNDQLNSLMSNQSIPRVQNSTLVIKPENQEQQLAFWQGYLQQLNPLKLYNQQGKTILTGKGTHFEFKFNQNAFATLESTARTAGTSLFNLLLTCYGRALGKTFKQSNFPIGIIHSARKSQRELSNINCYSKLLPFAHRHNNSNLKSSLIKNHETLAHLFKYSEVPFSQLKPLLPDNEALLSSNLDAVFVMHTLSDFELTLPNIKTSIYQHGYDIARFNLVFEVINSSSGIIGSLYYNSEVIRDDQITRFCGNISREIAALESAN
jgi:FkbH-like protein